MIFAFYFLLSEIKSPPKDGGGEPTSSQSESKIAVEQKQNIELKDVPANKEPALVNVSQQPPLINRKNSDQLQSPELNKVGQSVFYDCVDLSPMAEKQDDMKPERSDTEEESELYTNINCGDYWLWFNCNIFCAFQCPKLIRIALYSLG